MVHCSDDGQGFNVVAVWAVAVWTIAAAGRDEAGGAIRKMDGALRDGGGWQGMLVWAS